MQDVTLLSMKFPRKLWKIINECETGAIRWSNSGLSILLHYKKFQEEFLDPGNSVFKTSNITSFIRQLNLYGFRKVTSHNRDPICNAYNPDVHEFLHENFRSGRFDLLYKVCRKTNAKKSKNLVNRLPQKNSTLRRSPNQQRSTTSPISRLKKCQLALTETLEQIIQKSREEKQEKFVETPKEHMNFPSTAEYFRPNLLLNDEFGNWFDAQVITVDESNSKCRPWYDNVLRKYVECTCSQNVTRSDFTTIPLNLPYRQE